LTKTGAKILQYIEIAIKKGEIKEGSPERP